MFSVPQYVRAVLEKLEESGYEAFLIGGCVRDSLLSKKPSDYDIATNAKPDEVKGIFHKAVTVGERFGTVTVLAGKRTVEVTTYRSDGTYSDARHPETVTLVSSLKEDCLRRDFTMNAVAYHLERGIVDYTGGIADIKNRVIRTVGEPEKRFGEDALRILRAYRFSAQVGFDIEEKTRAAAILLSTRLKDVSAERVREELMKTLRCDRPEGIYRMLEDGILPYQAKIVNLSHLAKRLRLGAFYLSLERPYRENFFAKLRFSNDVSRWLQGLEALSEEKIDLSAAFVKNLLAKYPERTVLDFGAIALPKLKREASRLLRSGEPYRISQLAVDGNDLRAIGLPEGSGIGMILSALLAHCIRHPEDNRKDKLLAMVKETF